MSEESPKMAEWEKRSVETDRRIVSYMADQVKFYMDSGMEKEQAILQAMQQDEKDMHINGQDIQGIKIKNSGALRAQILQELEAKGI
jgi:hypothetical protein